jgi:hypothetical protein
MRQLRAMDIGRKIVRIERIFGSGRLGPGRAN